MPEQVNKLLDAAGIARTEEVVSNNIDTVVKAAEKIGYPIVMKVVGPIHKTDVGGVALDVKDEASLAENFNRMIKIPHTTAILLQPMLKGKEIFVGSKREKDFGTMVMAGLGGIFIEALKDVAAELAPVSTLKALEMVKSLKGYAIIKGTRGQEGVNEVIFAETVSKVSQLCKIAPEIAEMDINPLLGNRESVTAVDARIRIEKNNYND